MELRCHPVELGETARIGRTVQLVAVDWNLGDRLFRPAAVAQKKGPFRPTNLIRSRRRLPSLTILFCRTKSYIVILALCQERPPPGHPSWRNRTVTARLLTIPVRDETPTSGPQLNQE